MALAPDTLRASAVQAPRSLLWLRRLGVASAIAAAGVFAASAINLALFQSAHAAGSVEASSQASAISFDTGPSAPGFAESAQRLGARPVNAPALQVSFEAAPSRDNDLGAANAGLAEARANPQDWQAIAAARALGAYQALADAYSPWLEVAGSATLRVHRQNDRAVLAEDNRSQIAQLTADQRKDAAEEQLQTLRESDPKAFSGKMAQWALRKASWRQMNFVQIQATLTDQERAEQAERIKLQEGNDSSQASFNEDLSCRASVSEQALAEPADNDGEAFPGLSLPLARAIAAGHELGHCEAAVVFDPANPGHAQALWARLDQRGELGGALGQNSDAARSAFLSLANESFADSEAILLVAHLAGSETARAAALTLASARADLGSRERLQDAESHQTSPALRLIATQLADPAFMNKIATPRAMQQAALGAVRASLSSWLLAHGAPQASARQLVDAATSERAQSEARQQAGALLARQGMISVHDEPAAWKGQVEKQRALEGDLRPEFLAARRQASILSVADSQLPAPVVAAINRSSRKMP